MVSKKEIQVLLIERDKLIDSIHTLEEKYRSGKVSKEDYQFLRERYEDKLKEIEQKLGIPKAEAMRERKRRLVAPPRREVAPPRRRWVERKRLPPRERKPTPRFVFFRIPIWLVALVGIVVVGCLAYLLTVPSGLTVTTPPGWKAYINEEYGFGFAYPENWQRAGTTEFQTGTQTGTLTMFKDPITAAVACGGAVNDGQASTSLEGYVAGYKLTIQKYPEASILDEKTTTVSGKAGYKIIWKAQSQQTYLKWITVLTMTGEKSYLFSCCVQENFYEQCENTFNQIVGTIVIK